MQQCELANMKVLITEMSADRTASKKMPRAEKNALCPRKLADSTGGGDVAEWSRRSPAKAAPPIRNHLKYHQYSD